MSQDSPIDPDRWVDDHGDALYAYAILRLRDAEAAAEVVQDTFLEGLKALDKFQGRSSERTWLVGILKHKAIGADDRDEFDQIEFFGDRGTWKVRSELPELDVERAEFWDVFRSCLTELPASYAETFTLSELEGLTGPEICKILEITPTTLWARLHRSRLLLRKSLEARWFGPDSRPV